MVKCASASCCRATRCWRATGASNMLGHTTICLYHTAPEPMSAEEAIERVHDGVKPARRAPDGRRRAGGERFCRAVSIFSSVVTFAKEHAKGGDVPCFTISFARAGAKQKRHRRRSPGCPSRRASSRRFARRGFRAGSDSLRMLPDMVYMMDESSRRVRPSTHTDQRGCAGTRHQGIALGHGRRRHPHRLQAALCARAGALLALASGIRRARRWPEWDAVSRLEFRACARCARHSHYVSSAAAGSDRQLFLPGPSGCRLQHARARHPCRARP